MKKKHLILLLLSLVVMTFAGCRSKKEVAVQQPVVVPEVEQPSWTSVRMPVRVTIDQPMRLSMSGTMTMVRGEYILVSFRTFGFEVAQACATPEQMDLVLKMPSKMWVSEPLGDRLSRHDIDFSSLQDALLDNSMELPKLSGSVSIQTGGTPETPEVTVEMTAKGSKISATLSYDLSAAQWDLANPSRFSDPGSGYKKISLESAANALGK